MEEEPSESSLSLPVSRIKKLVKLDPEHVSSTESANYLLGAATELFIMNLTEQASFHAKSQKRKKIAYSDFYEVVHNNDSLLFMKDLVPKTIPLQQLVKENKVVLEPKTNEDDTIDDDSGVSTPQPPQPKQQTLPFVLKKDEDKPEDALMIT
ncbi:hypothetical protein KL919_002517 [Ogataea angusta]|uniref:Transcription factor CBF/NF-Y/archaeal histone domain-containing protein n=1 Tax=Pichia angusta TaxID=870730 RepID=A0AAN6DGQ2_PICAN|nr:uncharacterized protein KL928_002682 [Ogataea angusta]KAG7818814.1 hypothetical protein KL928_002682 [Ogataea angusta]KAG7825061.1 hypothetical protein KL909_001353 [Ogataea angusta]KAG7830247.1 hypothetical protein KL920_001885 [Ogataea angusta]KAG7834621.1 hypothetical protein KL943_003005 [Ogataea angusta]KAG7848132.1 hypothetical protein KL941_002311 [Ogataea angusta]